MRRALSAAAALLLAPALAGAAMPVPAAGRTGRLNGDWNVPVKSLVEMRFEDVVRQAYDLSCGAAALATLFRYFYGEDVTESQIIERMLVIGDREKIQKDGFSMLELKRFSEDLGYVSGGYRIEKTEDLLKVKIPVIALINVRGYNHFVVVRSTSGGRVHIADPAFGNRSTPIEQFDGQWNKVVLAVMSSERTGDVAFRDHTTLEARITEIPTLISVIEALRPIQPASTTQF